MSRSIHYRDLEPHERRAAMMRAAGMSLAAIGQFLDCDYVTIAALLKRPRVARYLLAIQSTMVDSLDKDNVRNLNEAIEHAAYRAFDVETTVMERLFNREYDVRAQLGAAATAQDILDRAGKRAPTQQRVQVDYGIDASTLSAAVEALREHERVLDITPGRGGVVGHNGEPEMRLPITLPRSAEAETPQTAFLGNNNGGEVDTKGNQTPGRPSQTTWGTARPENPGSEASESGEERR